MPRKVLIVEDDEHKIEDIISFWQEHVPSDILKLARSVREAVVAVYQEEFGVVVLDMALPTFNQSIRTSGGTSQPQGGLEVIRTLSAVKRNAQVIVFTQYDGIEIEGEFFPIKDSPSLLSSRYSINVVDAILYEYQSPDWRRQLLLKLSSNWDLEG